jgi:hypothetical protein
VSSSSSKASSSTSSASPPSPSSTSSCVGATGRPGLATCKGFNRHHHRFLSCVAPLHPVSPATVRVGPVRPSRSPTPTRIIRIQCGPRKRAHSPGRPCALIGSW